MGSSDRFGRDLDGTDLLRGCVYRLRDFLQSRLRESGHGIVQLRVHALLGNQVSAGEICRRIDEHLGSHEPARTTNRRTPRTKAEAALGVLDWLRARDGQSGSAG